MLTNNIGQLKEHSLDVIEMVFADIWEKVSQIPVPRTNTSEMEKVQIKVVHEFYKVFQKACSEYTAAFLLSPRNLKHLNDFLMMTLNHLREGYDQNTKKLICVLLRALQAQFNDIHPS